MNTINEKIKSILSRVLDTLRSSTQNYPRLARWILFGGGLAIIVGLYKLLKKKPRPLLTFDDIHAKVRDDNMDYDVAIIGAGPAGSTCAYYLSKLGKKVLLLEKEKFPHEKICPGILSQKAVKHLKDMDVYRELENEGLIQKIMMEGFVSASGKSFIGNAGSVLIKRGYGPKISVRRSVLDAKLAIAAKKAGADLREGVEVTRIKFSIIDNMWSIISKDETHKAKVLVCADGANSFFAEQRRIINNPKPTGMRSLSLVQAGTHHFNADHVIFRLQKLRKGNCTITRYSNGDIAVSCFLPKGKDVTKEIQEAHQYCITEEKKISNVLHKAQIQEMKVAPVRLGFDKTYKDHVVIIGEAAGHVNPLTGDVLQYVMDGAKIAAEVIAECLRKNDLSEKALSKYEKRWMREFGEEFKNAEKILDFIEKYPLFVDALVHLVRTSGEEFLADFSLAMSGTKSIYSMLTPSVLFSLLAEVTSLYVKGNPKKK